MLEVDRSEFGRVMTAYVGKNAEETTLSRWWHALKPYGLGEVKQAFVRRDREQGGYPEPRQIVERIQSDRGPAKAKPVDYQFWSAQDLLVACNFAAIDWETVNTVKEGGCQVKVSVQPGLTWVERVAKAYDSTLAEVAERIVGKRKDVKPADAAREFLDAQLLQNAGRPWLLPFSNAVPI